MPDSSKELQRPAAHLEVARLRSAEAATLRVWGSSPDSGWGPEGRTFLPHLLHPDVALSTRSACGVSPLSKRSSDSLSPRSVAAASGPATTLISPRARDLGRREDRTTTPKGSRRGDGYRFPCKSAPCPNRREPPRHPRAVVVLGPTFPSQEGSRCPCRTPWSAIAHLRDRVHETDEGPTPLR
jgi:hypothetical protein